MKNVLNLLTTNIKAFLFIILSGLIITSCQDPGTKQAKNAIDANGYSYQYVDGDPINARIYTLGNGLKVYLSTNDDAPRVQSMIAVRAGSSYDPSDNTGLAHYLEHMMFKGSDEIATVDWEKGE